MSVFLGGKWRELQVENDKLKELVQQDEKDKSALQQKYLVLKTAFDNLQQLKMVQNEKVAALENAHQLLEVDYKLGLKRIQMLEQAHEQAAMEREDLLGMNVWLRGKKDLGNTKNSVLSAKVQELAKKLKIVEHKFDMSMSQRTELEGQNSAQKSTCRMQEAAIAKKDQLIRQLQKEKTT